jgi:hypothetical protein
MSDLYAIMKGKAYASRKPSLHLLKTIMKDSDDARQALFLMHLPEHIPAEAHRLILLNGMAKEYAGVEDWKAYVAREN